MCQSFALKSSKVALGLAALETNYVTCLSQLSDIILSGRILWIIWGNYLALFSSVLCMAYRWWHYPPPSTHPLPKFTSRSHTEQNCKKYFLQRDVGSKTLPEKTFLYHDLLSKNLVILGTFRDCSRRSIKLLPDWLEGLKKCIKYTLIEFHIKTSIALPWPLDRAK